LNNAALIPRKQPEDLDRSFQVGNKEKMLVIKVKQVIFFLHMAMVKILLLK